MPNELLPTESSEPVKKPRKIGMAEKCLNLALAINHDSSAPFHFPIRFHLIEPKPGCYLYLQEGPDRTVFGTTELGLRKTLLDVINGNSLGDMPEYRPWTMNAVKTAEQFWMGVTKPIPMPRSWAFLSDERLTFHRLPWDSDVKGATPTWDEMLGRMNENKDAVMAWIGSLFVEESDRQAYVWLYGQGQNGKGALIRFLARVLGPAYHTETVAGLKTNFGTSALIGKRLVSFTDNNAAGFPATGEFKALTGGDPIRMEIKRGAIFTAKIEAKFLFASNERPCLSSELADMRRVIFVHMQPLPKDAQRLGEAEYDNLLWEEGGAFVARCLAAYRQACPNHKAIEANMADIEQHTRVVEEDFETARDKWLRRDEGAYIVAAQFNEWCRRVFPDQYRNRQFRNYLERKGLVRKDAKREDADRYRYPGWKLINWPPREGEDVVYGRPRLLR